MRALTILILALAIALPAQQLTVVATAPSEPLRAGMLFTVEIQIDGATDPRITIPPVAGLQLIETYPTGALGLNYAYFHVTATDARRIDIPIRVEDQGNSTVIIVPIVVNGGVMWRYALPAVTR